MANQPNQYSYAELNNAQLRDFAIEAQRDDYLRQPPEVQAQTIARVKRLLADERASKRSQPSWLMQNARAIYGRDLDR